MSVSNSLRFLTNEALAAGSQSPTNMLLPVFGGEVIAAFEEANTFIPLVNYKTMTSGKDMKFPAVWKIGSEYHEAGTELLGMDVDTKEYTISLDDRPLVSHFEVDDIDVSMAHFEIRSELAKECGREMARQMDRKIACLLLNAAATAADSGTNNFPIGGDSYSTWDNNSDFTANFNSEQDAAALIEAISGIAQAMDEKDVPTADRACVVKVSLYHALRRLGLPYYNAGGSAVVYPGQGGVFGNPAYGGTGPGIAGQQGYGMPLDVMGVPVYSSNHLPSATISTGPTKYQVANGDKVGGVMFHKSAIGVVQMAGITTETTRDVRRQSDFLVSKMLMGGGALRPYAAYRIGKN